MQHHYVMAQHSKYFIGKVNLDIFYFSWKFHDKNVMHALEVYVILNKVRIMPPMKLLVQFRVN